MSDCGDSDDDQGFGAFKPPAPLPDGVKKEIITEADSKQYLKPKPGDDVTVDYTGTLEDGTEFDSSHARDKPIVFQLGTGEVIKGWDLGIATMKKGEVAKFTLAPEYAYGAEGKEPVIPPSATLTFVVELVSFVSKNDLFNDGSVTKALLKEGEGFDHPKKDSEVRISLKVLTSKEVLQERAGFDYVLGSGLDELTRPVDKALLGMLSGETCTLTCAKDSLYPGAGHGVVTIELTLEETYNISDVSILKDDSVMKKQIKEGEGYETPDDGRRTVLMVEAATDGANPLPGFSGPQELAFKSGDGEVCDALEGAAAKMKKGERAIVTCHVPAKAREAKLGLNTIDAAKVAFTLELKDFDAGLKKYDMRDRDKVFVAALRKDVGAKLFKKGRWELALDKYNKVVELVKELAAEKKTVDDIKKEGNELQRAAELNKAACYLKMGDNTNCLSVCNGIIKTDHCNVKALFRRAKAHHGRNENAEALRDLDRVTELDPENAEAKALMPHCKRAQKVADKEGRSTFSAMCQGFGKSGFSKEIKKKVEQPVIREPEAPEQSPDVVAVTFRMDYKPQPGEVLHVVGSPDALSAWDNGKKLELRLLPPKWEPPVGSGRKPPEVNIWERTVEIPEAEGRIEYRYLITGGPNGERIEGGSHAMQLGGMGGSRQRTMDTWRSD